MRRRPVPNDQLRLLLAEVGWTGQMVAGKVNELGAEARVSLSYQRASVTQWLSGVRPRPPVPELVAEALSRALGRRVTVSETGLGAPGGPEDEPRPGTWWTLDAATHLVNACNTDGPTYSTASLSVPTWPAVTPLRVGTRPAARPATKVERADVKSAAMMLRLFSNADMTFGGGHARRALAGYLRSTITPWLRIDASPVVRRELLTTASRLSYLCGFMCFDDQLHGAAQRHYLTSLRLAAEGGHAIGYAAALRGLSVQAHLLGHHAQAVDLAEAAVQAASNRVATGPHAFLLGQLAVAHAAAGNRRDAIANLGAAEAHLTRAEGGSSGVVAYHPASLAHQQAATADCLGDRQGAVRALEVSVRCRPGNERRSRAITLARLAELQLAGGRLEQACDTWQRFLDDYPLLRSRRVDTALATLRARARAHQSHPAARVLLRRAIQLRTAGMRPT